MSRNAGLLVLALGMGLGLRVRERHDQDHGVGAGRGRGALADGDVRPRRRLDRLPASGGPARVPRHDAGERKADRFRLGDLQPAAGDGAAGGAPGRRQEDGADAGRGGRRRVRHRRGRLPVLAPEHVSRPASCRCRPAPRMRAGSSARIVRMPSSSWPCSPSTPGRGELIWESPTVTEFGYLDRRYFGTTNLTRRSSEPELEEYPPRRIKSPRASSCESNRLPSKH